MTTTKKHLKTFSIILLGVLTSFTIVKYAFFSNKALYHPYEEKNKNATDISGALQRYHEQRANLITGTVNPNDFYAVRNQVNTFSSFQNKTGSMGSGYLTWAELGPDNVGGRTRAIVVDRNNSNTIYAGGVSGGLWRSLDGAQSWQRYGGTAVSNIIISCIVQDAAGTVYYGTGETEFDAYPVGGTGTSGFYGGGVFKTNSSGITVLLSSTDPSIPSHQAAWQNTNALAADPNTAGTLYAGNEEGLFTSTDSGTTWTQNAALKSLSFGLNCCKLIKLSSDGGTIYAIMTNGLNFSSSSLFQSKDKGTTWTQLGKTVFGSNIGRMNFAIAPSADSVLYVSTVGLYPGSLKGVYQSTNYGSTWNTLATSDGVFDPYAQKIGQAAQGIYDNALAVDPSNPNRAFVAGVNFWQVVVDNGSPQWTEIAGLTDFIDEITYVIPNPYYIHADKHIITFDNKSKPAIMYVGCDGGIFKSTNIEVSSTPTYTPSNFGYNTVQFYGIDAGLNVNSPGADEVIGGAQDNGDFILNDLGFSGQNGTSIPLGGDGGDACISKLNPLIFFSETQYGATEISADEGKTYSALWPSSDSANTIGAAQKANGFPFVTPLGLWESSDDTSSRDSVVYTATANFKAGDTVIVTSKIGKPFNYKLTDTISKGRSIRVQDILQDKFYMAAFGSVWFTTQALVTGVDPLFFNIPLNSSFSPQSLEVSPDGNAIFVGGEINGTATVYRISGFRGKTFFYRNHYDANVGTIDRDYTSFYPDSFGINIQIIFSSAGQTVTGIGVDINNPNHVVISLGNYGYSNHVYQTVDALDSTSPTFVSIQNNLPAFPVYDAQISIDDPNVILLGTEYGVWASTNGGSSWSEQNDSMERVPVFMIKQNRPFPWDGPVFYIATHGRGVFKSVSLAHLSGIAPDRPDNTKVAMSLNIYPNPATTITNASLTISQNENVQIQVYDLNGRQMMSNNYGIQGAGNHLYPINTAKLTDGTYIVKLTAGNNVETTKIFVTR